MNKRKLNKINEAVHKVERLIRNKYDTIRWKIKNLTWKSIGEFFTQKLVAYIIIPAIFFVFGVFALILAPILTPIYPLISKTWESFISPHVFNVLEFGLNFVENIFANNYGKFITDVLWGMLDIILKCADWFENICVTVSKTFLGYSGIRLLNQANAIVKLIPDGCKYRMIINRGVEKVFEFIKKKNMR